MSQSAVLCVAALLLCGPAARAWTGGEVDCIVNSPADSGPAVGQTQAGGEPVVSSVYRPLTGKERWERYLRETFWSPGVFFRAAGPALGAHLSNEPPE